MANNVVKLKRSAVAGKIPSTTDLLLGEIALNTYDGRIFIKRSVTGTESIAVFRPIASIDDLTDVDTTTNPPTVGQNLQWNGTNWVPVTGTGTAGSQGTTGIQGAQGATGVGAQGTTGVQGIIGTQGVQGARGVGLSYQGNWNIATTYNINDTVYYAGSSYIAIAQNVGYQPNISAAQWGVIANQGVQGVTGVQGITGVQGAAGSGGGSPLTVSLYSTTGTYTNSVTSVTGIRFDEDSGFDVTDLGSGNVKVAMNSTFKTLKVDGQTDLVAMGLDTLQIVAGTGITITTNPNGSPYKTLTINSTGGGGGGSYTLPTASTVTLGGVKVDGSTIVIDGNGVISAVSSGGSFTGNQFGDPLIVLNGDLVGSNSYDSGIIINRDADINTGIIWSESGQEFRLVSTIEQGTVKGTVAVAGYKQLAVSSVKLNSETAGYITYTDNGKIVRTLNTGTARVGGTLQFNTSSQIIIPAGTTDQRPTSPEEGSLRYNSTLEQWEGYANGGWGNLGTGFGSAVEFQGFTGDGTTYLYTLNRTPLGAASIIVAVNGVVQQPGTAYQVSGNVLQFQDSFGNQTTPDAGDLIDIRFLSKPAVGTIQQTSYVGDGETTHYPSLIPIQSKNEILVFVNNLWQDSAVYEVSGYDVIFNEAPLSGERINLLHIATVVAKGNLTSAFHGFSRNANGDLLYTKTSAESAVLQDDDGNEIYLEKHIGTSDGDYSINTNGQLIYTYDGY